ncbi:MULTISPECIES: hypothetical protein [Halorussus]|uniref:DUF7344 domain-containing protein n=1 Tax=Halorussus TaxID=1070314 RepID=UPI000E2113A3|nr:MULTISPECIES: hypothetical protein [Halorussus]NHN59186.1 hypothetical protein [Halorussus sp. JP-T4]
MDFETAFDVLSNEHGRAVVETLAETGRLSRRELTARLLARGVGPDDSDRSSRRRLRIALHHNHLPHLADAGVVTYDDETVAPTRELDAVAEWLDRSGATGPPDTLDDRLAEFYA